METLEQTADDHAAPPPRFAPGATLEHFRIVRELGAGGMGFVLEAYDADLDRHVAIKIVRDREAGSAAGVRLVREAKAMAKLAHPNVVPVHEVGTIDGQVFVVMELVRGATLAAWLEQPRTWREIVAAFVQAGDGLAAAHRAGIVHRDFKPQNVFLDGQGHARVGDFGLARDDGGAPATTVRLADGSDPTRPAGTPAYMAPEQRAGEPVDARADQYSFAISLKRALDGKRAPQSCPPRAPRPRRRSRRPASCSTAGPRAGGSPERRRVAPSPRRAPRASRASTTAWASCALSSRRGKIPSRARSIAWSRQ